MQIDPKKLDWQASYRLLSSVIIPRPIAFISTYNCDRVSNLAPYSYFCTIGDSPPMVVVAPSLRNGVKKDTARNIEQLKDFVINMVTEPLLEPMIIAAKDFSPDESEFDATGLTPIPSVLVKSPRLKESPINIECTLREIFTYPKSQYTIYMGEILHYHIADEFFDENNKIDVTKIPLIGRLSGEYYTRISEIIRCKDQSNPNP